MKLLIIFPLFGLLLNPLTSLAQNTVTLSIEEVGLTPSCGVSSDCLLNTISYNIIGTPSLDLVGSRVESYILGINSGVIALGDPVSLSITSEAPCIIQGTQNNSPISDFINAVGLNNPSNLALLVAGPNVLHTFSVTYANLAELALARIKIMTTEIAPLNLHNSELRLEVPNGSGNSILSTVIGTTFLPNASNTSCFTLPITLVDYTAKAVGETSELNWITSTEINNDYFLVEKSINGKDWTFLAKVKGSGNSSSERSYRTLDNQTALGVNYYRLSQYDFNGDLEALGIKAVNFNNKLAIQVYPNPVSDVLTINIGNNSILNERGVLYNSVGKEVKLIEIDGPQNKVDISSLSKGVYYLKIKGQSFKIMVLPHN